MSNKGLHFLCVVTLVSLVAIVTQGCVLGGRKHSAAVMNEEPVVSDSQVTVDAYLFDVKFRQNGKRRSVRLDVYFTDTLALFTARAYLGKGVAKGIWRPDSSFFYFPTANEYFAGPLDELTRAGCAGGGDLQRLAPALLSGRLLALALDSAVQIIKRGDKNMEASLTLGSCEAQVALLFDSQVDSQGKRDLFYLKEFSYDPPDGKSRVVGKRRILKRGKKLSKRKFLLNIPSNAVAVEW